MIPSIFTSELFSAKSVPVKIVELMRELGSVTPVNSDEGSTYYTAPFNSEEEAQQQLPKFYQTHSIRNLRTPLLQLSY